MREGIFVYISGPITPRNGYLSEENAIEGLKMHLKLTDLRILSFCPQIAGAFPSAFLIDYRKWMDLDFEILKYCTHMLMLSRWGESPGAREEREHALDKGIPIAYSLDELLKMLDVREDKHYISQQDPERTVSPLSDIEQISPD